MDPKVVLTVIAIWVAACALIVGFVHVAGWHDEDVGR